MHLLNNLFLWFELGERVEAKSFHCQPHLLLVMEDKQVLLLNVMLSNHQQCLENRQKDQWMDRQTDRPMDGQTDREMDGQIDRCS